jgi:hypothetical protein
MKQEVKDIVTQVVVSSPTTGYAFVSKLTVAEWVAITLGVLQAIFLIRKWWREETEWGMRLKRWSKGQFTKPGDLQ